MSVKSPTVRRRRILLTGLVALGTASTVLAVPSAQAATPAWRVVKTYNTAKYDAVDGVIALSSKNAWAFSGTNDADQGGSRPLARHWNGSKWVNVTLPSGLKGSLRHADYSSASNIWAVGPAGVSGGQVLRWNGKKWAVAKKWAEGQVTGVTVVSPKDVWVFGAPGADQGVGTWHFNGTSWKQIKNLPFLPARARKVSSTDLWAIGRGLNSDSRTVGRWNGKSWKVVSTGTALPPDIEGGDGAPSRSVYLRDILARTAKNVWVVGYEYNSDGNGASSERPVLIHWNGTKWTRLKTPATGTLDVIEPDGYGGLWFAGTVPNGTGFTRYALRRRTSSGSWGTIKVSGAGKLLPRVKDMALIPGTKQTWGVGWLRPTSENSSDAVIFRYS